MKALYFALLLAACSPPPDYVSSYGTEYYFQPGVHWDGWQIEAQESAFIGQLSAITKYNQALKALPWVHVLVYPDTMHCSWVEGGSCEGFQDGVALYVHGKCPFESALTHEEMHWIQQYTDGGYDPSHLEPKVWAIADQPAGRCK